MQQRNKMRGGGGVTRASAPPTTPTRRTCTKEGCGGELGPSVDRHGASVDECEKCGAIYRRSFVGGVPTPPTPRVAGSGAPHQCTVSGCPGLVPAGGSCECCAKRQAFVDANLPKRRCGICGGVTEGRGRKYCKACKPIAQKVQIAKHHETNGNDKPGKKRK